MNEQVCVYPWEIEEALKLGRTVIFEESLDLNQTIRQNGHIVIKEDCDNTIRITGDAKVTVSVLGKATPHIYLEDQAEANISLRDKAGVVVRIRDISKAAIIACDDSEVDIFQNMSSSISLTLRDNANSDMIFYHNTSKLKVTMGEKSRCWVRGPGSNGNIVEIIGLEGNDAAAMMKDSKCRVEEGAVTVVTDPETWCKFYDVEVVDGIAILGKIVENDYKSRRANFQTGLHVDYTPGTIPFATDWDGGENECGRGLHFSPNVKMAKSFMTPGRRLHCPVKLTEMTVHTNGEYPQKCKAKGCCEPVWEVDEDGNPIDEKNQEICDAFYNRHHA